MTRCNLFVYRGYIIVIQTFGSSLETEVYATFQSVIYNYEVRSSQVVPGYSKRGKLVSRMDSYR